MDAPYNGPTASRSSSRLRQPMPRSIRSTTAPNQNVLDTLERDHGYLLASQQALLDAAIRLRDRAPNIIRDEPESDNIVKAVFDLERGLDEVIPLREPHSTRKQNPAHSGPKVSPFLASDVDAALQAQRKRRQYFIGVPEPIGPEPDSYPQVAASNERPPILKHVPNTLTEPEIQSQPIADHRPVSLSVSYETAEERSPGYLDEPEGFVQPPPYPGPRGSEHTSRFPQARGAETVSYSAPGQQQRPVSLSVSYESVQDAHQRAAENDLDPQHPLPPYSEGRRGGQYLEIPVTRHRRVSAAVEEERRSLQDLIRQLRTRRQDMSRMRDRQNRDIIAADLQTIQPPEYQYEEPNVPTQADPPLTTIISAAPPVRQMTVRRASESRAVYQSQIEAQLEEISDQLREQNAFNRELIQSNGAAMRHLVRIQPRARRERAALDMLSESVDRLGDSMRGI